MAEILIVGGGPVGLVAAHALHQAGISFVVLERRDAILEDVGASLVLDPSSLRVLSQLGLLERLNDQSVEVESLRIFTRDGTLLKESTGIQVLRECLGSTPRIFHRADLVRSLYEALPSSAKAKVLTGKNVLNIEQNSEAVTVTCADGSSFSGTMVIGADGVYSRARREMQKENTQVNEIGHKQPVQEYQATYRCLWDAFPIPKGIPTGHLAVVQHTGQSLMMLTGKEKAWLFLYEKLPKPTSDRIRYSREDVASFAELFADWPISSTLKVGDVYDETSAGMSNLEEGIVKNLSSGRVVLVGDACHKFTPNAGLGFNNGIQDVVALCNELQTAVSGSAGAKLGATQLTGIFKAYGDQRRKPVKDGFLFSAMQTRLDALASFWYFLLARYVLHPEVVGRLLLRYISAPKSRQALVLNYITGEEPFSGTLGWLHPIKPAMK